MLPDSNHMDHEALDEDHPEGTYILDIADAAERAIALQLFDLDTRNSSGARGTLLQNVKINGIAARDAVLATWPDALPASGVIECDFVRIAGSAGHTVLDGKKMYAIESEFKRSTTTDSTKVQMLATLAPYSYLYASQIRRLLQHIGTGDQLVQTACVLLLRCVDLEAGGYDAILRTLDSRTAFFVKAALGMHGCFRSSNPTGHYALHLSVLSHRLIAARLKDSALEAGPSCLTWRNIMCAGAGPMTRILLTICPLPRLAK